MKCLITGHTKGIGKSLYDAFVLMGFEVIGVSRSNGYDISERYQDIVALAETCDLVINNAYCQDYQTRLLRDLAGKTKIISIGIFLSPMSPILSPDHLVLLINVY